ncbi:MAG TPA: 50S ribosomal protein L29 [Syntrophales bacterium]|nr:50S ribosomal protein L29 [Syntrophales bacterium]HPI57331.1 50S ribosomal protein L29 [Syntrophales bacterium]HPN25211.1 50S ribosomal protein L29 [Syntrophales bacterium]HQM29370.1 50S ribosomal protein L29 [Syntrophales bacterium]
MKIKEIRDLSVDELKQKERDLVDELFRLKVRHATGQLDSSAVMKSVKKDIARIKTILKEREIRG